MKSAIVQMLLRILEKRRDRTVGSFGKIVSPPTSSLHLGFLVVSVDI